MHEKEGAGLPSKYFSMINGGSIQNNYLLLKRLSIFVM